MGRPRPGSRVVAQVYGVVDSDDPDTIVDRLQPFAEIAPLLDQSVQILPYAGGHERAAERRTTARATRWPGPG